MTNILKGQIVKDNEIIKTAKGEYDSSTGFFVALVNICDELELDIPIWTANEDKALRKKGEAIIKIDDERILKIIKLMAQDGIKDEPVD